MHSTSCTPPSPEDLMIRSQRLKRIETVFREHLSEPQHAVMVALYLGDMSEAEAAEALGLDVREVMRRTRQALAALRHVPGLHQVLSGGE
jgi:DNA-directed RNA polymerase specialized sigma24 family protein